MDNGNRKRGPGHILNWLSSLDEQGEATSCWSFDLEKDAWAVYDRWFSFGRKLVSRWHAAKCNHAQFYCYCKIVICKFKSYLFVAKLWIYNFHYGVDFLLFKSYYFCCFSDTECLFQLFTFWIWKGRLVLLLMNACFRFVELWLSVCSFDFSPCFPEITKATFLCHALTNSWT